MRSTHSIVQGRRWRRKKPEAAPLPPEFFDRATPQETTAEPLENAAATPEPEVCGRKKRKQRHVPRKVYLTYLLLLITGAVFSFCLCYTVADLLDSGNTATKDVTEPEPTVQAVAFTDGNCLLAVPSGDLRTTLAAGDVVSLCNSQGVVPPLKYVKVAQVTESTVGVLLSEEQVNAYLAIPGKVTFVLRARDGDEAAALLQWQESYNDPTVSLTFAETEITLGAGQAAAAPVKLTVAPAEATPETLIWDSSAPEIVTVDADGTLTGVAVGEAEITVAALGRTATLHVRVSVLAETVRLSKETVGLPIGGTVTLTATVLPENVTDKSIQWSSDNETVATVNADGTVTALHNGVAVITATCGEATAQCKITVYTPAASLSLSKAALGLKVGGTERLTAAISPDAASSRPIQWKSSNPAVATVSEDGTVKAVKAGTVTITATCDSITATCTVTVS